MPLPYQWRTRRVCHSKKQMLMGNNLGNILEQLVMLRKGKDTKIEISSSETTLIISNPKVVGEIIAYLTDKL